MTSTVVYEGELRTTCTHVRSADFLETDAPIDNNGKGERFSPTDLFSHQPCNMHGYSNGYQSQVHGF